MPKVEFGEKTHFDGNKTEFLELKNKDQKFHVRFLGSATYDGKHFFKQEDGKWNISYCPRIMNNKECQFCEKFFEARKAMKVMKNELGEVDQMNLDDKKEFKRLENIAKLYGETTTFYYPVLNRETEEAGIMKCAQSIRWMLDEEHSNGVPILDFDYIVKRTEVPGKYYTLTRLDSSMIKPLTEKENDEINRVLSLDMDKVVYGKQSGFDLTQGEGEVVNEEPDFPEEEVDIDEVMKELDGEIPDEQKA